MRKPWTRRIVRWAVAVSPSIALAALTAPCGAQAAQVAQVAQVAHDSAARHSALIGIIKDSLGMPVPYATVFVDSGPATIANDSGVFRLAQIPHGLTLFGVRRIGYSPLTFTINMPPDTTLSVSIRLHQVIARLSEVTVEEKRRSSSLARAGFYDRQQMGFGTFLSRIDVQLRAPTRFAQVLYGVLGVFVDNHNGRLTPLGRSPSGGFCPLSIFLDGHVFRVGAGEEFDLPPNEIEAIEVYPRSIEVPVQFQDITNPSCGSIAIWTKVD
jgi:hypothetical protein